MWRGPVWKKTFGQSEATYLLKQNASQDGNQSAHQTRYKTWAVGGSRDNGDVLRPLSCGGIFSV